MFTTTQEKMEHMERVNVLLLDLTQQKYRRRQVAGRHGTSPGLYYTRKRSNGLLKYSMKTFNFIIQNPFY